MTRRSLFAAAAVAMLAQNLATAASAAEPTPEELLQAIQARYGSTRTLRLDFTQRYVNRATGKTLEESGVLWAAKPGKMRWEYRVPEAKLFVLRGELGWFHIPEEGVVYKLRTTNSEARRIPALLLAGHGDLTQDFTATREPGGEGVRLRLSPRRPGEDYDVVILTLEPGSVAIQAMAVVDAIGNLTEYRFRGEERNQPLAETLFEFVPPKDTEVVETTPERPREKRPGR